MNLPITLLLTQKDLKKKKKKDNIGFLKFRGSAIQIVLCVCVCFVFLKVNNKILLKTKKIVVNCCKYQHNFKISDSK